MFRFYIPNRNCLSFSIVHIIIVAVTLSACNGDNTNADEFSSDRLFVGTEIDISGNAAEGIAIPVEANCSWKVTTDASWIHITSPKAGQGNGNDIILLDVDASTLLVGQTGKLILTTSSGVQQIISVNQRAGNIKLMVTPATLYYTCEGGDQSVEIVCNTTWAASSSVSWLKVNNEMEVTLDGDQRLTIHADSNGNSEGLRGVITFKDLDNLIDPVVVNVEIGGKLPQLTVSQPNDISAEGGRVEFNLLSNFRWEASIGQFNPTGTETWAHFEDGTLIITGEAGQEVKNLIINVSSNHTEQQRTFVLNVRTLSIMGENAELQYTITQEAGTRPIVYTPVASDITMNEAVMTFAVKPSSFPIIERGVIYSTEESNLMTGTLIRSTTEGDDIVVNLSNLSSGTVYYLCAYATNAVGTTYSNMISFKTRSIPNRNDNEFPE